MKNKIFYGIISMTLFNSISYANEIPFPSWFTPARAKLELMDYFVKSTNRAESFEFYKIKEIKINPKIASWGLHIYEGLITFDTPTCKGRKYEVVWGAGSPCNQDPCMPIYSTLSQCPMPENNN